MAETSPNSGLKITALSVQDAARVLSKAANKHVLEASLREDIDAGAPVNTDGTINIVQYAAWLIREVATRGN